MSILQCIGNTPLIELKSQSPNPAVRIWAKLEFCNPSGSLKDRIALHMIEEAEKSGRLKPGMTIIEATSGNTGIALGMVCAAKGYKLRFFMSERKTIERRKMLAFWGAELCLTTKDNPDSHIYGAKELAAADPEKYFYIDQNENEDNVNAHCIGTGAEIVRDLKGDVAAFVSGFGTGGCLMGVSRAFEQAGVDAKVYAVEPAGQGSRIDGLKHSSEGYQPPIYDRARIEETFEVTDEDAIANGKLIARKEGIIAGISTGANLYAARKVAERIDRGNVVTLVCDRGERYFSTDLFKMEGE